MLVPSEWNSGVNVLLEQSVEKKEKQKKKRKKQDLQEHLR